MNRILATQLSAAVRRWFGALSIVADDDGLETDLMPATFARPQFIATRTPVRVLARRDA